MGADEKWPLIQVLNAQSITDIEQLFRQLERHPECDLALKTQIVGAEFGGVAALLQLLISWSKRSSSNRLVIRVGSERAAHSHLETLAEGEHGLVALLGAQQITLANRSGDLRAIARDVTYSRVELLRSESRPERSGQVLFFVCADEFASSQLPQLYTKGTLRSEAAFGSLFRDLLSKLLGSRRKIADSTLDDLAAISHELFKNTHEWALVDWDGATVANSVRGLRFEVIEGTQKRLQSHVGRVGPVSAYIAKCFGTEAAGRAFLEVSVFDSGSGVAQRFAGRSIFGKPLEEEYDWVIKALAKWATTTTKTHRGIGLHRVMTTLTESEGFLRIRTGRLNLFRDFMADPYTPNPELPATAAENRVDLVDWDSDTGALQAHPWAAGTLLSILIPLRLA